jgi:hypothetical protein
MLQALEERQIAMLMSICLKLTLQFLLSGPEMTPWYTVWQQQFLVSSALVVPKLCTPFQS